MNQSFNVDTSATPERLFEILSDLSLYPKWLELVDAATLDADQGASDTQPAWHVTLKAKLGPFARTKKLRMARTINDAPNHVRFERSEVDGREHSAWTMNAHVKPGEKPNTSSATVELIYSGELWSKALESILVSQVDDAAPKLRQLAEAAS